MNKLIDQIHALRAGLNALEAMVQEAKERERIHLALLEWLLTGDVGQSSEQIIKEYMGLQSPTIEYPRDYSDFKRCYQLCEAIPEVKTAVKSLASKSEHWQAIYLNWSSIWYKIANLGDLLARVEADRKSRWERGVL